MRLPLGDWQFWVVTGLALCAAGYLLRNVLPIPILSRRARRKRQEKKTTLTISAKKK
ncbi:hypothetical protein BH11PLA1_BH11PLA1_13030 [soil metagenome]